MKNKNIDVYKKIRPLMAYFKEFGTLKDIKQKTEFEYNGEVVKIGWLVQNIRRDLKNEKISSEMKDMLDYMEFDWEKNSIFENNKKYLLAWYFENKTLSNMTQYSTMKYGDEEIKIGNVLGKLRTLKKNNENEYEELKRDEIFIRSVITLRETFQDLFNEKIISEHFYPMWNTNLSLNDILIFFNQINTRFSQGVSNYSRNFVSIIVYCDRDMKNNKAIYLPKKSGFWVKKEIKETLAALQIKEVKEIGNKITVQVLNGTDIVGFAGRCKRYLESYGFDVIETGNADHSEYKNTVIIIRNNETKALKLADLIKCKRTIYENRTPEENGMSSKIDVRLILGRDFDGKVVK
jgi:hypothetical protein